MKRLLAIFMVIGMISTTATAGEHKSLKECTDSVQSGRDVAEVKLPRPQTTEEAEDKDAKTKNK